MECVYCNREAIPQELNRMYEMVRGGVSDKIRYGGGETFNMEDDFSFPWIRDDRTNYHSARELRFIKNEKSRKS